MDDGGGKVIEYNDNNNKDFDPNVFRDTTMKEDSCTYLIQEQFGVVILLSHFIRGYEGNITDAHDVLLLEMQVELMVGKFVAFIKLKNFDFLVKQMFNVFSNKLNTLKINFFTKRNKPHIF